MKSNKQLNDYFKKNDFVVYTANKTNFSKFNTLTKQIKQLEIAKNKKKNGVMFYNENGTQSYFIKICDLNKMKKKLLRVGESPRSDEEYINIAVEVMKRFEGKKMCIGGSFALKLWEIYLKSKGCDIQLTEQIEPSNVDVFGKYYPLKRGMNKNYLDYVQIKLLYTPTGGIVLPKAYEDVYTFSNLSGNAHLVSGNYTYNVLQFGNEQINVSSIASLESGTKERLNNGTKPNKAIQAIAYIDAFKLCPEAQRLQSKTETLTTGYTPQKSSKRMRPPPSSPGDAPSPPVPFALNTPPPSPGAAPHGFSYNTPPSSPGAAPYTPPPGAAPYTPSPGAAPNGFSTPPPSSPGAYAYTTP